MEGGVEGFGAGHVVGDGADAADAGGDDGEVFGAAAFAEAFEAAEFGDLEVGVVDVAGVVEEEGDFAVAFEAGDGVDDDFFHCCTFRRRVEWANEYL